MINKVVLYLLSLLMAISIFIFGFILGIKFTTLIKGTNMLQDKFIESTQTMSILNYLDKWEVEKARQFLLLHQDSTILAINSLAEHADKKTYETACNILNKIAKYRKENLERYTVYTYPVEDKRSVDIRKEVAKILDKWESCKNKLDSK